MMQNSPSLGNPENPRVGDGPLYDPIRQAARDLGSAILPTGVEHSSPNLDLGALGSVQPEPNGNHRLFRGLAGHSHEVTIEELRAGAIALLAYCEAHQ